MFEWEQQAHGEHVYRTKMQVLTRHARADTGHDHAMCCVRAEIPLDILKVEHGSCNTSTR